MKKLTTIRSDDAKPEIEDGHFVIRDVRDKIDGIRGRCGNVEVGFTWATEMWFWEGGFFGNLERPIKRH
jgi:hypothetical protein